VSEPRPTCAHSLSSRDLKVPLAGRKLPVGFASGICEAPRRRVGSRGAPSGVSKSRIVSFLYHIISSLQTRRTTRREVGETRPTTLLFADPPTALAVTAEGASCVARAVPSDSVSCMLAARRVPTDRFADGVPGAGRDESPVPRSWKRRATSSRRVVRRVCSELIMLYGKLTILDFETPLGATRLPTRRLGASQIPLANPTRSFRPASGTFKSRLESEWAHGGSTSCWRGWRLARRGGPRRLPLGGASGRLATTVRALLPVGYLPINKAA